MADQGTGRAATVVWAMIAIIIGIGGFIVGASISQPVLLAQPTREVLIQADNLDRVLLAELRDPRDISEDVNKIKEIATKIPNGQGTGIAGAVLNRE